MFKSFKQRITDKMEILFQEPEPVLDLPGDGAGKSKMTGSCNTTLNLLLDSCKFMPLQYSVEKIPFYLDFWIFRVGSCKGLLPFTIKVKTYLRSRRLQQVSDTLI